MYLEKGYVRLASNKRDYYIDGNTARQLNTVPQRVERPERIEHQEKERKVNQTINRNTNRAKAFDLRYTLALVVATLFVFAAAVSMLNLQADVTEQRRQVAALENNLNELKNSNDEYAKQLESAVDLTKIYDMAVNELGMVYPKNGQVISYEASNPDYVKQFKDVPTK